MSKSTALSSPAPVRKIHGFPIGAHNVVDVGMGCYVHVSIPLSMTRMDFIKHIAELWGRQLSDVRMERKRLRFSGPVNDAVKTLLISGYNGG